MRSGDPGTLAIGGRYGAAAATDWRRVLSHFALNDGFALLVVIVPDRDGATLCHRALGASLRGMGQGIHDLSPDTPRALRRIVPTLRGARTPERGKALWIEGAVPASVPDHAAWERAWRWGLATLNQNRNAVQRLDRTVLIVGTPALVPLFREAAPDLWSIRDLVARVEPDPCLSLPVESIARLRLVARLIGHKALIDPRAAETIVAWRARAGKAATTWRPRWCAWPARARTPPTRMARVSRCVRRWRSLQTSTHPCR